MVISDSFCALCELIKILNLKFEMFLFIIFSRKKIIIGEVLKEWPEEKETPWFGKNSTEGGKLIALVDRMANDERFTYQKYGLGRNAIKDMILTHMRERRRTQKDATLSESAGESTVSISSTYDSSSNNASSPPTLHDKKRKEHLSYFNTSECCHEQ